MLANWLTIRGVLGGVSLSVGGAMGRGLAGRVMSDCKKKSTSNQIKSTSNQINSKHVLIQL